MSRRVISAQFNEPTEFHVELERDKDLIERRIVRVTEKAMASSTGVYTLLTVEASCIVEGRLVRCSTFAGQLWGMGDPDAATRAKADRLRKAHEEKVLGLELDLRSGVWEDEQ